MTTTTKVIIPSKVAEAVETTQYTSLNCMTIIDKFTAFNPTGAIVTLTASLVTSGGAGGGLSRTVSVGVAPGRTYTFPELVGHTLESGDFISTIAGTAASLNIRASGRQITA